MSEKDLFTWLERENLLETAKKSYPAFKSILNNSLKLHGEKLVLIGDFGLPEHRVSPLVLACYALAAREMNADYEILVKDITANNDSEDIAERLKHLSSQNSIVAVMSQKFNRLAKLEKSFRTFVRERRHRFVSTPGLAQLSTEHFQHLVDALSVDYYEMFERGQRLKRVIDDASELFISTDRGTALHIDVKNMPGINNSGIYEKSGSGGNIPAGEVYCAPNRNRVEGRVVVDGSIRTLEGTILLKKPVTMTFEKGLLVEMEGESAKYLEESLRWAEENSSRPYGIRRFAELGIGTNPKASIVGPTVINEKALGTAHIAIGSNYWFGGSIYAPIHLDHVFKNPVIEADGERVDF
ncbi:hypothetical protein D6764_01080 [Candidatus Woesearchaeota archaeon]|nr:MAG: hypothetical protein D6764_01080 [Candidatus Woesearchaeota archaeon]